MVGAGVVGASYVAPSRPLPTDVRRLPEWGAASPGPVAADNLLVTPRGGILLCEDDASGSDGGTHPLAPGITDVNRLIGLNRRGGAFEFAVNVLNDAEFAGACFSPDGSTMFVNIFGNGTPGSGMTCAITGPWRRGAL